MDKSSKNIIGIATATLPVDFSVKPAGGKRFICVRFLVKDNNLSKEQDMPPSRKITTKHTKSQVKKSLGFRHGTHYGTMLTNPTVKLQAFIYPKMSETNLKTLVKTLETADVNQKNAMKKEASDKRRIHTLEQERKRKEKLVARRQEAVMKRTQLAQEKLFLNNLAEEVEYNFADENDFQRMLNRYLPRLQAGERFLIKVGETWYTLSLTKFEELTKQMKTVVEQRDATEGSDDTLIDVVVNSTVTVERPGLRLGRDYTFANGEFLPYTHNYEDPDLTNELANLGCWTEVNEKNYVNNCLWLAFKSAGVSPAVLEAMKFEFLQRKISRKNIKKIAELHHLCVKIRTDGDKNIIVYGNEKAEGIKLVELAIIKGVIDHYIHFYKTKFNSYAMEHYDELKDRKNWWAFINEKKRQNDRGMNSLDLLRAVLAGNHVKKIDISTEGIFRTQFFDRLNVTEFDTLDYPEEYSGLFHELRISPDQRQNTLENYYYSEETEREALKEAEKMAEAEKEAEKIAESEGNIEEYNRKKQLQKYFDDMDREDMERMIMSDGGPVRKHGGPNNKNDKNEGKDMAKLKQKEETLRIRLEKNPKTLETLDNKFKTHGFRVEERIKHLKKAGMNAVEANVFFDFEASPYDRHEEYCCRISAWLLLIGRRFSQ